MNLTENVMVLFGRGFGEIIKPAPGASVCAEWDPIPPKKMYLTATIDCLEKLSRTYGGDSCGQTSSRLTKKSYGYYSGNSLFVDCNFCYNSTSTPKRKCAKVPQTLDSSARAWTCIYSIPSSTRGCNCVWLSIEKRFFMELEETSIKDDQR